MSTAPLLVELLSEELPPRSLDALSTAFARVLHESLAARELVAADASAQAFATPRRLALLLCDVHASAPERSFSQKLVPVSVGLDAKGAPTEALRKKLGALNLAYDPQCISREPDGRQEILVFRGVRAGAQLAAGLQEALAQAIERLPIPKVMRYQLADGKTTVNFVRPVHGLVALHGTHVVPVTALGLSAGRQTMGHRFHANGPLVIAQAQDYEHQLYAKGKVIASMAARRARIVEQLKGAAARLGAHPIMPEELLDEVNALVEWPMVYESGFAPEFLQVPQSCLILTMQRNQKYFALQDAQGRLRDRFLLVSNIETRDPEAIIAGNARVVRARLADAKFFFDQDRLQTLESRLRGAAAVVYHRSLGSQLARIGRIVVIARRIAKALPRDLHADPRKVERAASLAKADLGTLMVGEFPELQGEMGGIYARGDGEDAEVAVAIEEHYRPRFAGDAVPQSVAGACVALADKIETLAGLFGAGERASGDKDPYALRRNALGVLRILQERALPVAVQELVRIAFEAFDPAKLPGKFEPCPDELVDFLFERLRGLLQERGYASQEVEAVVCLKPGRMDRILARMSAVRAFMQLPQAANLAAANKRIANLLKKSEGAADSARLDAALLVEPAERDLAQAFDGIAPVVAAALAAGDDAALLRALTPLKLPVDRFFDEVMVLVDDPALRANRLALLANLRAMMNRVADIALLAAA